MNETIKIKHKFLCKNPDCFVYSHEYELHILKDIDNNYNYHSIKHTVCVSCGQIMEAIY